MKKTKIKERMSWRQRRRKEIVKLINELKKHCENDGLFQIHLNSGNFEGRQYVSTVDEQHSTFPYSSSLLHNTLLSS